jgi:DNA-binding CsgD family transcriptional regulator
MLYGRGAECGQLNALLDQARQGRGGALLVRGEPGIGKSALLEYTAEAGGDMRLLSARGVESETEIAYAGLYELVRPLLERVDDLPEPQSEALASALALRHSDRTLTPLAVGAATLGLLSLTADERPVLCLVDDAHSLDPASREALLFAARRLGEDPVAMIFAERDSQTAEAFAASGIGELTLRGLGLEAARGLIGEDTASFPTGSLQRVWSATAGNPLALHEAAAVVGSGGIAALEAFEEPLPLSERLSQVFAVRAAGLPEGAKRFALLASCDETRGIAERAAPRLDITHDDIAACESSGLVSIRDGGVRFLHPLVRSAIYHAATDVERRRCHGVIADTLPPPQTERSAWHRALAARDPDEALAAQLEGVAAAARGRNGVAAAAALYTRAARLSVDDEARAARLYEAGQLLALASQYERAAPLLDEALEHTDDPLLRADIQLQRARVLSIRDERAAHDLLTAEAERVEALDRARASQLLREAAFRFMSDDPARALAISHRVLELAPAEPSVTRLQALLLHGHALFETGSFRDAETVLASAAHLLSVGAVDISSDAELLLSAGYVLGWTSSQRTLAHELLAHGEEIARREGQITTLGRILNHLAEFDVADGEWLRAYVRVCEAHRSALERGFDGPVMAGLIGVIAFLEAAQGRQAECRVHARSVLQLRQVDPALAAATCESLLGFLALSHSRVEDACTHYAAALPKRPRRLHIDAIEAFTLAGQADQAKQALAELGRVIPQPDEEGTAFRGFCCALIAQGSTADRLWQESLEQFDRLPRPLPFGKARVELGYGRFLRRHGQRRAAREQLRSALAKFERLGAEPWAAQARRELRASGETARRRSPETLNQLTAQELQIALLIADGTSNREAAARLYVSPKTIAFHLGKVYRKLGIRTRHELQGRLSHLEPELRPAEASPASNMPSAGTAARLPAGGG